MDVNKRTRTSAIAAITIAAFAMVKEEKKNPKNEKKRLHGPNHGSLKEESAVHSMHC